MNDKRINATKEKLVATLMDVDSSLQVCFDGDPINQLNVAEYDLYLSLRQGLATLIDSLSNKASEDCSYALADGFSILKK